MPRSSSVEPKQLSSDRPRSSDCDKRRSVETGRVAAAPAPARAVVPGTWFRVPIDPEINAATPGAVLRDAARTTWATCVGESTIEMSPSACWLIESMLADTDSCLHLVFLATGSLPRLRSEATSACGRFSRPPDVSALEAIGVLSVSEDMRERGAMG